MPQCACKAQTLGLCQPRGAPRLPNSSQAIVTSYQFQCRGNVTAWQAIVQPGVTGDEGKQFGVYDIAFQVWRPSPTVESDGCYSLVGENRFTSITLVDGNGNARGIRLVSETPPPSSMITVEPGDVVGYLAIVSNISATQGEGIVLDEDRVSEAVWYHAMVDEACEENEPCMLSVGTEPGRNLPSSTNLAPVVSASINCFECHLTAATTTTPTNTGGLTFRHVGIIAGVFATIMLALALGIVGMGIAICRKKAAIRKKKKKKKIGKQGPSGTNTNELEEESEDAGMEYSSAYATTALTQIPVTENEAYSTTLAANLAHRSEDRPQDNDCIFPRSQHKMEL